MVGHVPECHLNEQKPNDARRHRVLVVDDDDAVREALVELLQDEGWDVMSARNGHDALRLLESECLPCVIVLDWVMSEMNGAEFRKHQLNDSRLARLPTLIYTASRVELPEDHTVEVLEKPGCTATLLRTLENLCADPSL